MAWRLYAGPGFSPRPGTPFSRGSARSSTARSLLVPAAFLLLVLLNPQWSSAQNAPQQSRSQGLEVEVVVGQTSLVAGAKSSFYVHLVNVSGQVVEDVSVSVCMPDSIIMEEPGKNGQSSGCAVFCRSPRLEPLEDKTCRLVLSTKRRAPFDNFNAITRVGYSWFPTANMKRRSELFRTTPMKAAPMEEISVGGVTASFAVYVLPGLAGLIAFCFFVPVPKTLEDNKYLMGFLLSAGLLVLLEAAGLYDARRGIWVGDLLLFTGIAAAVGASAGFAIRRRRIADLSPRERYPADHDMTMQELLATYVLQTGSVKAISFVLRTKNNEELSAITVSTRDEGRILLPKRFLLTGEPTAIEKVRKAYDDGDASRLAGLLRTFQGRLEAVDFIAERVNGEWLSCTEGGTWREIADKELADVRKESEDELLDFQTDQ